MNFRLVETKNQFLLENFRFSKNNTAKFEKKNVKKEKHYLSNKINVDEENKI
jgi:hypothetical protein